MKNLINVITIATMFSGGLCMLVSFKYFWSNEVEFILGAGFPFVGGAILFGSGLISMTIFNKNKD